MFKTIKNQKGITLVELLAVMVIVGIIAAISIPAIGNLIENTRKDAVIATAQNMQEAARLVVSQDDKACSAGCTIDFTGKDEDLVDGSSYMENLTATTAKVTVTVKDGKQSYSTEYVDAKYTLTTGDAFEATRDLVEPAPAQESGNQG